MTITISGDSPNFSAATITTGTVTTLTTTTISDGTNSTSSTNCIQGSAKAWCRFDGTTSTINASYNISSLTKNSAGNFTFNFTNAFADANYSSIGSAGNATARDGWMMIPASSVPTTTQISVRTTTSNLPDGAVDMLQCSFSIFR